MSLTNASNPIIHPDIRKHFDGTNLTAFETMITHILSGRHVDGFRTGTITCPSPADSPTSPTDWSSSTPTTLSGSLLGLKDTGTAKELWDSITTKYRNKSTMDTMAVAHAKDMIAQEMYIPGKDIVDHFKRHNVLRRAVVDAGGTISDDEHITHLISPDPSTSFNPLALAAAARHALVCSNPNCKRNGHLIDNCYWPGGGKEGQFPPNFGNRHAHTATMATTHIVL
ncbi:hypothetical protein B0H14DRAFT_2795345 [Mycena olivaceomarginata]|nr:hypothetical protein B0H14DRAFT_2795345 [Mycena olivaceomarginata]